MSITHNIMMWQFQNPPIIDLAWKLKIFVYRNVTKIDKFDQNETKWDKNDHFWSDAHTSVFRGMSVRIANTKSPFGAKSTLLRQIQLPQHGVRSCSFALLSKELLTLRIDLSDKNTFKSAHNLGKSSKTADFIARSALFLEGAMKTQVLHPPSSLLRRK